MTAAEILAALRKENGPFPPQQFAWLYEVANGTGGHHSRSADAVAMSLWPSRGLWLAGFEVKVSRGDWLRELKDVAKSWPVQKYCLYWWVATPPGVVAEGELPPTWGHYVINENGRLKREKNAPELQPQAIDLPFVAAILRRQSEATSKVVNAAVMAVRLEHANNPLADENCKLRTEVRQLNAEVTRLQRDRDYQSSTREAVEFAAKKFEESAGLPPGTISQSGRYGQFDQHGHTAAAFLLAQTLRTHRGTLTLLRDSIEAYLEDKGLDR